MAVVLLWVQMALLAGWAEWKLNIPGAGKYIHIQAQQGMAQTQLSLQNEQFVAAAETVVTVAAAKAAWVLLCIITIWISGRKSARSVDTPEMVRPAATAETELLSCTTGSR